MDRALPRLVETQTVLNTAVYVRKTIHKNIVIFVSIFVLKPYNKNVYNLREF